MKEETRYAMLLHLVDRMLNYPKGWRGETHIQKSVYFLQELLGVGMGFQFILYKRGPFSFDLRNTLTMARAKLIFDVVPQDPYGPSWEPGDSAPAARKIWKDDYEKFGDQMEFVVSRISTKDTFELERLATALYMKRKYPDKSDDKLVEEIRSKKPHISADEAYKALREVKTIGDEAKKKGLIRAGGRGQLNQESPA